MIETILGKTVDVVSNPNLYKWANVWGSVQKRYYTSPVQIRREKQILDFVHLNEFKKLYIEKDTDILKQLHSQPTPNDCDLVIVTDQKFSRLPCSGIVERINQLLNQCPRLLICLNRHYINIDNQYHNPELDSNINLAITQWLRRSLPDQHVIDLSLDYVDRGDYFTWVVPDRIYYIKQCN
jgi:hypothetical protein